MATPAATDDAGGRANRLPVAALLAATAVSLVGTALTAVALPWFVLQTTGSAARTGLTAFAVALPMAAAGVLGGPLIDRLGAKRVGVAADLVGGFGIGAIPLLYHTVGLPFWGLLALVFTGALLALPGLTARRAMLPELAALAGVRLERVNAAAEAAHHLAYLLGPPAAGLLIAWLGPSRVLWLDAASFACSAAIVAAFVPSLRAARPRVERYAAELKAGLRFLTQDRLLLTLAITLTISNLLTGPFFAVLLPVYVDAAFGEATALGLAAAGFGAGSLLGAVVFGAVGHRLPRRATWLVGFMVIPLELWVLTVEPSLPVLVAVQTFVGAIGGGINPLLVTIRHERIPAELRGRVFGAFSAIAMAAQPLGMLLAGGLIAGVGFRPTAFIMAGLAQAMGVALLFVGTLRRMDESRRPRTGGETAGAWG